MKLAVGALIAVVGASAFLFLIGGREVVVGEMGTVVASSSVATTTKVKEVAPVNPQSVDEAPDQPLASPPSIIKAVYLTGWSGGNRARIDQIKKMARETEVNAVVLDVKDYTGEMSYPVSIPGIITSSTSPLGEGQAKFKRPNALIREFHDEGIYMIARVAVFQDVALAKARPQWALKQGSSTTLWADNKKLHWMDPAAKPVWDYAIAIANDSFARGFDEVNFDYIRFPSDGKLDGIGYPYWNKVTPRREVMRSFFQYLRAGLPGKKISADLFGLVTVNKDDLGIGQVIEDAYPYFDYIAPMVYPSHYANGFLGYKNPALMPYEVIEYSMEHAVKRLLTQAASTSTAPRTLAKLRPWFQDFDLGADYDAAMVRKQINAWNDVTSSTPQVNNGWMMWAPSNVYTVGAFRAE